MKLLEKMKKNKRVFLFIIILFIGVFVSNLLRYQYDATWEYGMSHAIRMGEVPYRDFNTITPPLFIGIMSLGLWIYDSFWTFLIEVVLIEIIAFYYVDKAYQKNAYFYIASICYFSFFALIPSYNLFSFLMVILLLCFEKLKYSNKLIGFFMGLLILSKHTIGIPIVCMILIGLWIRKEEKKKILERIGFLLIPCFLFFIYLLLNHLMQPFMDLCIYGLFDFASQNTNPFYLIGIGGLLIISIYLLIKNKKEISYYYILGSITFIIPIFDISHFAFYFPILIMVILGNKTYHKISYIGLIGSIFFFTCVGVLATILNYKRIGISLFSHYHNVPMQNVIIDYNKAIHNEIKNYKNYYVIDGFSMYYDLFYDRKITYYDVLLRGNYGYDGTNKLLKRMEKEKDCYFVMKENAREYHGGQFMIEAVDYIEKHYEHISTHNGISIYYKS